MGKKHQSAVCIFGANFMLEQLGSLKMKLTVQWMGRILNIFTE